MLTLRHEAKLGKSVCGALVAFQNLRIITQIWHSLHHRGLAYGSIFCDWQSIIPFVNRNHCGSFPVTWMVAMFNISSSLAWKGVTASPTNYRFSPGTPSDPTDLFLPIFNSLFLIILVLIIRFSPELAKCISGMLWSQQKTDYIIGIFNCDIRDV